MAKVTDYAAQHHAIQVPRAPSTSPGAASQSPDSPSDQVKLHDLENDASAGALDQDTLEQTQVCARPVSN